jgi:hypothetical protein
MQQREPVRSDSVFESLMEELAVVFDTMININLYIKLYIHDNLVLGQHVKFVYQQFIIY